MTSKEHVGIEPTEVPRPAGQTDGEADRRSSQMPIRSRRQEPIGVSTLSTLPGSHGLKQEMGPLIKALGLGEAAQSYLTSRWLDQLTWMEGKAARAQAWYYGLRLAAILGGLFIPVLVGWQGATTYSEVSRVVAGVLGAVVAGASAVEGFFRFGERWQHYRRTAEGLKAEFWRYSQLSGPYKDSPDSGHAFPTFVERVEHTLGDELETYFTAIQPKSDSALGSSPRPKSGEP